MLLRLGDKKIFRRDATALRANPPAVKVHFGPALESPDKSCVVGPPPVRTWPGLSDPLRGFLAARPRRPRAFHRRVYFRCPRPPSPSPSPPPPPSPPSTRETAHFRYAFSRNAAQKTPRREPLRFSIVFISLVVAVAVNPVTTVITYCFTGGAAASLLTHRARSRRCTAAAASNTLGSLSAKEFNINARHAVSSSSSSRETVSRGGVAPARLLILRERARH